MRPTLRGNCSALRADGPSEAPAVPAAPPMQYASSRVAATTHSPDRSPRPTPRAATSHSRRTALAVASTEELHPGDMLHMLDRCPSPTVPSTSHRSRCGASPATTHALQIPDGTDAPVTESHATDRTPAVPTYSTALPTHRNLQAAPSRTDATTPHRVSVAVVSPISPETPSASSHAATPQPRLQTPELRHAVHHADVLSTECCTSHSGLRGDSGTTTAADRTTAESLPDAASHADAPEPVALLLTALSVH